MLCAIIWPHMSISVHSYLSVPLKSHLKTEFFSLHSEEESSFWLASWIFCSLPCPSPERCGWLRKPKLATGDMRRRWHAHPKPSRVLHAIHAQAWQMEHHQSRFSSAGDRHGSVPSVWDGVLDNCAYKKNLNICLLWSFHALGIGQRGENGWSQNHRHASQHQHTAWKSPNPFPRLIAWVMIFLVETWPVPVRATSSPWPSCLQFRLLH